MRGEQAPEEGRPQGREPAREEGRSDLPALGRRAIVRSTVGMLLANAAGATFVYVFLSFIAPGERLEHQWSIGAQLALFVGYFFAACLVGWRLISRLVSHSASWVLDDRLPTDDERGRTLALPRRVAAISFLPWLGASLFYAGVNAIGGYSSGHIVQVAIGTLDGGLVTCAICFLLMERVMRPVVAVALAGVAPRGRAIGGVRTRLLLAWLFGSAVPLAALAWLPDAARGATERADIGTAVQVLSCAGILAGLVMTITMAKAVADPLVQVRKALDQVREGRLDVVVPVDRGGDLGMLQAGVNNMVDGLRERRRLEEIFGRHVGVEVAARALDQDSGLESEQREASVLFIDILGSTAMTEVLAPQQVVATLNAYFGCVVRVVGDEGGWVNKFEGDGALCVFGAPATQPDHAARALRAARRLRAELLELRALFPGLDAAIGVSSGPLVAGNVGTETRYEYTVIGAPVNEASRLTDMAKGRAGRVLASEGAIQRAGDEARRWATLGSVALRGKTAPTTIFEPLEVREPVTA